MLPDRQANGEYPSYTEVGAYPLVYLDKQDNVLCAPCASKPDCVPPAFTCDVYWEGDPLECDECGTEIESAYGPVEAVQA